MQEQEDDNKKEQGKGKTRNIPPIKKLKDDMEAFREELRRYRNSHFNEIGGYSDIKNDDFYKELKNYGDVTKADEEKIKRFYPNIEEIFKERPPVQRDEKESIKWRNVKNKVYIKEFQEDPDVIKAQLLQMKSKGGAGRPLNTKELSDGLGRQLQNLQEEIPLSKRDFERYVGENLVFKLAVFIILVGVIVLYRYAISQGYINMPSRMVVGIVLGTGFFVWAHYQVLNSQDKLVNTLVISGLVILYYTIKLSFADYYILSQIQAFVGGIIVTGIAIFLSMLYGKRQLSIAAILGGYATPFLVSTGDGNYAFFFGYVLVLNIGMLVIAHLKKWQSLNVLAFSATVLFLTVWSFQNKFEDTTEYFGLFIFATLFYLSFFTSAVAYAAHEMLSTRSSQYFTVVFGLIMYLLASIFAFLKLGWAGYFPHFFAGLAVFHLYFSFLFYSRTSLSTGVKENNLLAGMVLAFIAGSGFFAGEFINSFWSVSAILLAWLGVQLSDNLLRNLAGFSLYVALVTLFYSWSHSYWNADHQLIFILNSGFWAGCITFLAATFTVMLYTSDEESDYTIVVTEKTAYIKLVSFLMLLIGYLIGLFELLWNTPDLPGGSDLRTIMIDVYSMLYILFFRYIVYKVNINRLKVTVGILMTISVLFYIFAGQAHTLDLRQAYLDGSLSFAPFSFHYLNVLLSVLLVYLLISDIARSEGYASGKYSFVMWFLCTVSVFHATYELEHTIVLVRFAFSNSLEFEDFLTQIRLTGFSILWSGLSVLFMYLGIRNQLKELRMIALALLGVTIVKFLIFDFWNMQPIWQIIAAIFIGALLLAISQMYGRLRALVESGQLYFDKDKMYSQDETARMIREAALKQEMFEQTDEGGEDDDDFEEFDEKL